jgi:hypothetical protein
MSNVENSLYLWDTSNCSDIKTKNHILTWSIDSLLQRSPIKTKIIVFSMKGLKIYEKLLT